MTPSPTPKYYHGSAFYNQEAAQGKNSESTINDIPLPLRETSALHNCYDDIPFVIYQRGLQCAFTYSDDPCGNKDNPITFVFTKYCYLLYFNLYDVRINKHWKVLG